MANHTIRRENSIFRGPRHFHVLAEKLDAIDNRIPAAIRAQVRPLDDRVRENFREFQTFRMRITNQVSNLRQEVQRLRQELSDQQLNVAEHNKFFRELCVLPDSQPRPQNVMPGTSNATRAFPSPRPFVGGSRPGNTSRTTVDYSQKSPHSERPGYSNATRTFPGARPFEGASRPGNTSRATVGIMTCRKCGSPYKKRQCYINHFGNGICDRRAARNRRTVRA